MKHIIFSAALIFSAILQIHAEEYINDPSHTTIGFEVTHMVISTVEGEFKDYSIQLRFDPDNPGDFYVKAEIKVKSVDTDNPKRDEHLRSPDFFDAAKYPLMTFESHTLEKTDDGYIAAGTFTLHGVSKPMRLPFTLKGPITDPWGNVRIGVGAETTINRKDFGVSWSKTMDGGVLVVSDEVTIKIQAEFIQKK